MECLFAEFGTVGVPKAEAIMSASADLRLSEEIPDLIFFLAHPRTVALGLRDGHARHPKDLLVGPERLAVEGIALTRSVRGGGITYHWPGQVVCYPVLALRPQERDIRAYMARLEEVGIRTLERFGIHARRRRDAAAYLGLWVDTGKIASMGVRVGRWVTSFGFVINSRGEHPESRYVRPCGLEGVELVTVEEILGEAPPRQVMVEAIKESFSAVFGRILKPMPESVMSKICGPHPTGSASNFGSGLSS
jgi:lipoate-protein ligase B